MVTAQSSVTVIIVNWNSGSFLADCLKHIQEQTVRPERVLVVDNGSSDDSIISAEALAGTRVRRLGANLGFARANNVGLADCSSEFVALLNPDAFPEPDWLERLLSTAESHPEIAAFGSRQLRWGHPQILDGIGDTYHVSGLVWRVRHGSRQEATDLESKEIFSPCAAAALYRRQNLVDVGGFDETYFCYVEDVDLGFRLRLAGHKSLYVPEAVVHHVGSATTGGQNSDFSVYHGHRNLVWTYVKNMPGALFWVLLPVHLLLNVVTIGVFMCRGQGGVILRAKCDAIKGLPAAWNKRRQIQAQRVAKVREIWRALNKNMIPVTSNH